MGVTPSPILILACLYGLARPSGNLAIMSLPVASLETSESYIITLPGSKV